MEIKEKTIEDQKIAVINHKGSMEEMELLIAKLMGWVETEDLKTEGNLFAIYYNNPKTADKDGIVYDIGIPIASDSTANPTELIQIVDMLEHRIIAGKHKGSYENIRDSYDKMIKHCEDNNYDIIGSPKEVYIKSRFNNDNGELLTEIQFPIIKM